MPPLPPAELPSAPSAEAKDKPPPLVPADLPYGCFAFSTVERAALCVVGESSIQGGGSYKLVFVGAAPSSFVVAHWASLDLNDHPLLLDVRARASVEARVAKGAYQRLPPEPASILSVEGGPTKATVGGITIALSRRKISTTTLPDGMWDNVKDTLTIQMCKQPSRSVHVAELGGPMSSHATSWSLGPNFVLIEYSGTFGQEGDSGGHSAVFLVDAERCLVY